MKTTIIHLPTVANKQYFACSRGAISVRFRNLGLPNISLPSLTLDSTILQEYWEFQEVEKCAFACNQFESLNKYMFH